MAFDGHVPLSASQDIFTANLTPLGHGQYLIEVAGVSLKSRYPENRMCKVLLLAGVTGKLDVFGPNASGQTILRSTVDIEKHGHRQLSETDNGFRYLHWMRKSEAPLRKVAKKLKRSLAQTRKHAEAAPPPGETEKALHDERFHQSGKLCRGQSQAEN